jgi:hypothetical protein
MKLSSYLLSCLLACFVIVMSVSRYGTLGCLLLIDHETSATYTASLLVFIIDRLSVQKMLAFKLLMKDDARRITGRWLEMFPRRECSASSSTTQHMPPNMSMPVCSISH